MPQLDLSGSQVTPFDRAVDFDLAEGQGANFVTFAVPAGQTLVVESISGRIVLPTGEHLENVAISHVGANETTLLYAQPNLLASNVGGIAGLIVGHDVYAFNTSTRAYLSGDVNLAVVRHEVSGLAHITWAVHGYLVPNNGAQSAAGVVPQLDLSGSQVTPFDRAVDFDLAEGQGANFVTFAVPAGQTLVVESISGRIVLPTSEHLENVAISHIGANETTLLYAEPKRLATNVGGIAGLIVGHDVYTFNTSTRAYLSGDVNLAVVRSEVSGLSHITWAIHGYLVPDHGVQTTIGSEAVPEGSNGFVSFTNRFDSSPTDTAAGFLYSYDFNNDGTFEIVESTSAGQIVPASFLADGPMVRIRGRIKDKDGDFTDYTTDIVVNNVAPTATFSNSGAVLEGNSGTVSFSNPFDPSPTDTAAGFKYSYDFDNDGTFEIVESTSATQIVPASFLADGPAIRTVRGRIQDKDGAFTDYTTNITINIPPVNNAPVFIKPANANQTVLEDAGVQSVQWAAAASINTGPGDIGQTVHFVVTNNNTALFSAQPAISPTGVLIFASAADANGTATVTVILKDDGGTAHGGQDSTTSTTFTITVEPVNDAPVRLTGTLPTIHVDEDESATIWSLAEDWSTSSRRLRWKTLPR